jgi:hypothetical protein
LRLCFYSLSNIFQKEKSGSTNCFYEFFTDPPPGWLESSPEQHCCWVWLSFTEWLRIRWAKELLKSCSYGAGSGTRHRISADPAEGLSWARSAHWERRHCFVRGCWACAPGTLRHCSVSARCAEFQLYWPATVRRAALHRSTRWKHYAQNSSPATCEVMPNFESCHSYQLRLCEPVSEEKRLAYGSQATSRVVGRRTSMLPRYPRSILCLTSSRALNPISMNGISLVNLTMDSRIVRKLECAAFGLPAYLDRG